MINVSDQFKKDIKINSKVILRANIEFPLLGKIISIEGKHFQSNSAKFEDATSSNGSFDIGAAIVNQFTAVLNNTDGFFDGMDLNGAVFYPQIGKSLSDGTVEWVNKGAYTVDNPVSPGKTISIQALDNMHKFEIPYSKVRTKYPATLGQIVRDIALYCGVPMASGTFDNEGYVINERPDDSTLMCIKMLSYAAQIAGCFARCNNMGELELRWYNEVDEEKVNHHISKFSSINTYTSDIYITGVKVMDSASGDDQQEYLFGTEDYSVTIESNPLVEAGKAQRVAEYIGARVIGIRFRPLTCNCIADPTVEAGDSACVQDRYGKKYYCYLNNVTYSIGSYMKISCEAKTPSSNRATPFSNETKAIMLARKEAEKKIEVYNESMQRLTALMTQSFGVFKTEEAAADGSVIYYMHDKPTLEASQKIWKMTADAFAVSSDGGKTWNAGVDANGNAVVNILSAIGVKADWIQTGTFSVIDDNGNTIFKADKDTGQISINIEKDGGTLTGVIDNTDFNVRYMDSEGNVLSGISFDFEKGQFNYEGGITAGNININDNFIVDSEGNAVLKQVELVSADEQNELVHTKMENGKLVIESDWQASVTVGFRRSGRHVLPEITMGARDVLSGDFELSSNSITNFIDGMFIGNDVYEDKGDGRFYPREDREYGWYTSGIFFDFEKEEVYVVSGETLKKLYTGDCVAVFG